jgi:hypothetical protein
MGPFGLPIRINPDIPRPRRGEGIRIDFTKGEVVGGQQFSFTYSTQSFRDPCTLSSFLIGFPASLHLVGDVLHVKRDATEGMRGGIKVVG